MLNYFTIAMSIISLAFILTVFFLSKNYFRNYSPDKISGLECQNKNHTLTEERQKVLTYLTVLAVSIALLSMIIYPHFYVFLKNWLGVKKGTSILAYFILGSLLIVSVLSAIINRAKKVNERFFTTKNMSRLAIFTALSIVLYMWVKFPLPFIFPSFLDIQISDMPALLAGFMLGPAAGAIVIILRCFIKLPLTGTGAVGELGDLILGLVYVLSASIIYIFFKSRKGAIIALISSSCLCVITAIIINRFILIPFYTAFVFQWEVLLEMVKKLYGNVTKENFYNYYLWLAVLPFNLLRCFVIVLVTFFMYKPTARIFGAVERSVSKRKKAN